MRRSLLFLAAISATLALPAISAAQTAQDAAERQAFFDEIQAPNWLGTDIDHTSIKRQRGGTCWSFSTVAMLCG